MTPEFEQRLSELEGVPITLLPVRLETRFIAGQGGEPVELRVRVYPDQIHLDVHQPDLAAAEIESGKVYWRNRLNPATADRAWPELTRGIRPARAAWIVRKLTPLNLGEPGKPRFPKLQPREAALDKPLAVRAMPTRWLALGYDDSGGEILRRWFDHPIPDQLFATASLTEGPPLTGDAAVDAYLGWAANYDAAIAAGMAVTITAADLPSGRSLADGFDRFVVLGIDWRADSAKGAAELASLLDDHEVSDGLGYLKPGTPTNNVADAPAAGGAIEVADPATPAPKLNATWSSAARLGRALGVDAASLGRLPGAAETTARVSSDLVNATWAGSLGYFTDQLLAPLIEDEDLVKLRQHATAHLHPLGPLPTLRVGRQPLGVLPVLAPSAVPADDFTARLSRVLERLRPMWEISVPRVARLLRGDTPGRELERVFLDILRRAPWTKRIWYRRVYGPLIAFHPGGIGSAQRLQAVLRNIGFLDSFGVDVQPRITPFVVHDHTRYVAIPFLGPSVDGAQPDLSYLEELRALTTESGARDELNDGGAGWSVLEALTRFSAIQELDLAAARVGGRFLPGGEFVAWRTTEISGIGSAADRFTEPSPLVLAGTRIAELGGRTAPEEVARLLATTPADSRLGDLKDFQAALGRLAKADPADVDTALRAYLGACSHRLDAWFTSIAGRQLDAVRARRPKGTHVGGFGYVENLRPEQTPDSLGYVLAPSVAHAVTAGLLRSGYLAHQATGTESLDVNLSSDRVKLALDLIRGVATGVPLAVLLGYRIERALRDTGLSVLILPLRTVFPLRTPPPAEGPGAAVESTPPNNVTDAALLLERWETERDTVLDDVRQEAKPPPDDATLDALASQIDVLADVYDALADVVVAEAVHQIARGQPERAQAATRFLDRQEPPVEPDVTASPRTSSGYVQRCLVALSARAPGAAWQGLADPRSAAEPRLNTWLAALLGTPARWKFSGQLIRADGKPGGKAVVTLAELDLSPLSLVVTAGSSSPEQPTELEERIARQLAAKLNPAPGESIELLPETAGALGAAAFTALASAARRVLRAATPVDAHAFAPPDATVAPGVDVDDLEGRANAATNALRSAVTALDAEIAAPATQTKLADALERVSRLGVGGAVPPVGVLAGGPAPAPDDALDLAQDVAATAHARLEQLDKLEAAQPAPEAAAAHHQRRIATVFGGAFPVLGAFTIPDESDAARSLRPAAQTSLLSGDPLAPVTWMTRMARVRPELDALWHLLVSAEAASGYNATAFAVAQIPHAPAAAWAALPFGGRRPTADVAIAVHAPSGLRGPIAALTVDAWTEQLPLPVETAGAAFHYDAPSNRAPQSAIVAVPPRLAEHPWTLEVIAETIKEAFDLARIRGVNLHDLPAVGAVLPALYLPFDPGSNVPGIDLDRLAGSLGPDQLVLGRD